MDLALDSVLSSNSGKALKVNVYRTHRILCVCEAIYEKHWLLSSCLKQSSHLDYVSVVYVVISDKNVLLSKFLNACEVFRGPYLICKGCYFVA